MPTDEVNHSAPKDVLGRPQPETCNVVPQDGRFVGDVTCMSTEELRSALTARGLSLRGDHAVLLERLRQNTEVPTLHNCHAPTIRGSLLGDLTD